MFKNKTKELNRYRIVNHETGDILVFKKFKKHLFDTKYRMESSIIKKGERPLSECIVYLTKDDALKIQELLDSIYRDGHWRIINIDDLDMFGIKA